MGHGVVEGRVSGRKPHRLPFPVSERTLDPFGWAELEVAEKSAHIGTLRQPNPRLEWRDGSEAEIAGNIGEPGAGF
jgi:hypothetical protein